MSKYLLGFDLGSYSSKGVIVDVEGNIKAFTRLEHAIQRPSANWAEQDPINDWWMDFIKIVNYLLKNSGVNPKDIMAVGITGLVPSMCPLDESGDIIRNAILHSDNRAYKELEYINNVLPEPITLGFVLPKLLWFRDQEPTNYQRTAKILNPHSYLIYRLTGKFSSDIDTASIFGGVFAREQWDSDFCKFLGISPEILPEIYPATSIVGEILPAAAEQTGLHAGTPVIAGTGDSFASMIGSGVIHQGELMIYLGTSGTQILLNRDITDLANTIHFGQDKAEFVANVLACGESLESLRNILGVESWDKLNDGADKIRPGSEKLIFLPHLKGQRSPIVDVFARGLIYGLEPGHTKFHIYKALLEGIGYNLKEGFLNIKAKVQRIIVSGGGAKSSIFRQILSDILEFPIEYPIKANAAIGIAYLAGYSIGLFSDFDYLAHKWIPITDVSLPNENNIPIYQEYFKVYQEVNQNMQKTNSKLHNLT